jgi:hypothetical protein
VALAVQDDAVGGDDPEVLRTHVVHGPTTAVHHAVVVTTQRCHVLEAGGAALDGPDDVVRVGPRGRGVAPGEDTAAVPGRERTSEVPVGEADGGPEVEWRAERVDDERRDGRVAGEQVEGPRVDRLAVLIVDVGATPAPDERRVSHGDGERHVRHRARGPTGCSASANQFDESIGEVGRAGGPALLRSIRSARVAGIESADGRLVA